MLNKIVGFLKSLFFRYQISAEEKEFIKLNASQWNLKCNKKVGILVEGFLASPTSIVEKSRLANAAREVFGVDARVIVRGVSERASNVIPIYRSFGLHNFYLWWRSYLDPLIFLPAITSYFYIFLVVKNGHDLIAHKKDDILIGDLIYDSLVRNIPNSYTINRLKVFTHSRIIFRSMIFYYGNKKLLNQSEISAVVSSHNVYAEYGMLCRQAHACKAVVLLKDMDVYKLYDKYTNVREHFLKVKKCVVDYEYSNSDLVREVAYYDSRVLGTAKQVDIQNAYTNKKSYSKSESIALHKNFSASKKCIFVMAHAFSDAPHVGGNLLFKDYYDFLEKTLLKFNLSQNVNCFVKSHPSSYMWGESGGVETIIEKNKLGNICILPSDFNTASIIDIADVIVTARGTAGLEFSCAGIPAITAGDGYYQGFGICHEPKTVDEFYKLLAECHNFKRLNDDVIRKALIVLYQSFNNLYHSDVLPAVQLRPGDNYESGFRKKFYEMNGNMKSNKLMSDEFYSMVKNDLRRTLDER